MRSKANFMSHPIHPMLVAFPVAFIFGMVLADVVGVLGEWEFLWSMGAYLSVAAVVTGLAAGVAGFIDYLFVVPPKSSGKRRATWHMAVNVLGLAAIAAGWFFRDWETLRPGTVAVLLELVSGGLVTWGGWMGGTLVYRNQIGVDHRYAHAGKWREVSVDGPPGELATVEGANELKPGQMMLVHASGRRIVLARTDQGYAAFDDRCRHKGGPLADGTLACNTVTCPWHGSQYDVNTGAVQAGPTEESIDTYRVEAANGTVRLALPAS